MTRKPAAHAGPTPTSRLGMGRPPTPNRSAAPPGGRRGRPRSFRDRRTLLGGLVAGMLVGLVLLAWTGLQSRVAGTTPSAPAATAPASHGPTAAPSASIQASGSFGASTSLQATGRIVALGAAPAGATEFSLRIEGDQTIRLEVVSGPDSGSLGTWLRQQQASGAVVQVTYRVESGMNVVERAELPTRPAPSATAPS